MAADSAAFPLGDEADADEAAQVMIESVGGAAEKGCERRDGAGSGGFEDVDDFLARGREQSPELRG